MAYVSVGGFGGGSANRAMMNSGGGFGISNIRNITGIKAPGEKSIVDKAKDFLTGLFGGGAPSPDKADTRVVDTPNTPSGSIVQSGGVSQNMLLLGGAGLLVAVLLLKKKK